MTTWRRSMVWWGIALIAVAAVLGWATVLHRDPFDIDTWWSDVLSQPPSGAQLWVSLLLDDVGGGWWAILILPLAIAAILFATGRRWGALYFLVATAVSAGFVQLLKQLFSRQRPEDILVVVDAGSFPSGHVANAATVVFALWVLFPSWWMAVVAVVWTVAMAFARTYLSAHWASDTAGGALIGVGVALLVAGIMNARLLREQDRRVKLREDRGNGAVAA
ncbi:phosphatase PAP2 family protein [Microbacterium oryzae]|uniref:phosphatase PAP2 family protein n=1 Tax=Microbacterium oryzae TaxID=743009 RepID=UPI0025B10748|nr:phosphatase PAP2 family protein [Microbacterium oryzae]MDN3311098.1 phosphatase PAP2 family protein [Microbacterium oryzae]